MIRSIYSRCQAVSLITRSFSLASDCLFGYFPGQVGLPFPVAKEKERLMSETAWQREYMLRIIYDEDYIYTPKDFVRYEILPPTQKLRFILIAIDLAISMKSSADRT